MCPESPGHAVVETTPGGGKLNTDASFLADTGLSAAGAVARDYRGLVFFSESKRLPASRSVEEAEANAILTGLSSLATLYRGHIILEVDCAAISRELQPDAPGRSPEYGLICDIKSALSGFASYKISTVGRGRNALAHGLAEIARKIGDSFTIAGVPESLRSLANSECNPPPPE